MKNGGIFHTGGRLVRINTFPNWCVAVVTLIICLEPGSQVYLYTVSSSCYPATILTNTGGGANLVPCKKFWTTVGSMTVLSGFLSA